MQDAGNKNKIIWLAYIFLTLALVISAITYFKPALVKTAGDFIAGRFSSKEKAYKTSMEKGKLEELGQVNFQSMDFKQLQDYFQNLAKTKGGEYAFRLLKVAPVGPNIDLHLIGHVVGDELYKQEGLNGITVCDNDFRNACSHSIVIGLFSDEGSAALPKIAEACRKAPGGSGAYSMCFHGLGHGILAYYGYKFDVAVNYCKQTGTPEAGDREAQECIGGMVMEIVGGGFHDREFWEKERKKLLSPKDPLALCRGSLVPDDAKTLCYVYITPYLFEAVGANMASPTEADFAKAFPLCEKTDPKRPQDKLTCYGGFGKEFDVLARDRDIRLAAMNNFSDDQLKTIYKWCGAAKKDYGITACATNAMGSLYWGGENDPNVSVRFCSLIPDAKNRTECFTSLFTTVNYYQKNNNGKSQFCALVPEEFKDQCQNQLSN